MTNKIICLLSAALLLFSCTVEKQSSGPVSIIPQPKFFQLEEGVFTLDRRTPIYVDVADSATLRTLAFLNDRLEKAAGFKLEIIDDDPLRHGQKRPTIWQSSPTVC